MRVVIAEPKKWLARFAWCTVCFTILLICSGGLVTSKGVGLAVPDWPTTFGYNMFLFPVSRWVGGIFYEHSHRLIASIVGLLTVSLSIWLWVVEPRRWLRNLGFVAVAAVVLQGVLGGLRVTMLQDEIGIFHACLAQGFLGLLILIALSLSGKWRTVLSAHPKVRTIRTLALLTTAAIYLQLALGAMMRHQHRDLAIMDFPTAYGQWIPETGAATLAQINVWREAHALSTVTAPQIWLQMAHRAGALLVGLGVLRTVVLTWRLPFALRRLRNFALGWLVLLMAQVTLGAWTVWSNKAADIATAHVAVGAGMLGLGVILSALCFRVQEFQMASGRSRTGAVPQGAHA